MFELLDRRIWSTEKTACQAMHGQWGEHYFSHSSSYKQYFHILCARQTLMSTCWNAVGKLVSKEIFVLLTQCGHLLWGMSLHHNLFMLLQLLLITLMDIIWNWTRNVAVVKQTPLTKHSVPCANMQCMSNLFIGQTNQNLNYTESVD